MKKLLIVHTRYQNRGGEDISVDNEIQTLSNKFEIESIIFENSEKLKLINLIYFLFNSNFSSVNKLKEKLKTFEPDIVYVHNTWFMGSLGIFKYLKKNNINTILKLHNFRYFCTRSFSIRKHLDKRDFCQCCSISRADNLLFNKYFKESYLKSILVNYYGRKYFKIIQDTFFKLIVLTQFHKNFLLENNIRNDKIFVNPNQLQLSKRKEPSKNEKYIVYAGRVSSEKGVEELIKVFIDSNLGDLKLKIIGQGPKYDELKTKYTSNLVEFIGEVSNKTVLGIIHTSKAVITYTKLFEGQPTLLTEASLLGVPSIFPDTGGVSEFFPKNYKFMFKQFSDEDLKSKLNLLIKSNDLEMIGNQNREYIKKKYSTEKVLENFIRITNE